MTCGEPGCNFDHWHNGPARGLFRKDNNDLDQMQGLPRLGLRGMLRRGRGGEGLSTATSGRAREYKVRDAMIGHGWELIARAAASKGPADIIMAHEEHGLALVQVGTASKRLGPADRKRLLRAAWLCSALPIVATVHAGTIRYALVHDGVPSDWEPWTP